jgi:hypothetical protein
LFGVPNFDTSFDFQFPCYPFSWTSMSTQVVYYSAGNLHIPYWPPGCYMVFQLDRLGTIRSTRGWSGRPSSFRSPYPKTLVSNGREFSWGDVYIADLIIYSELQLYSEILSGQRRAFMRKKVGLVASVTDQCGGNLCQFTGLFICTAMNSSGIVYL